MTADRVESRSFRPAFDQICGIFAIAEIRDPSETLRRLVCSCFSELSGEGLESGAGVTRTLDELYGLRVSPGIAQQALNELIQRGDLSHSADGMHLVLRPELAANLRARIAASKALEDKVRAQWLESLTGEQAALDKLVLWEALQGYLFRAFRRHGVQTAALLDASIDAAPEYSESLTVLLHEAVAGCFEPEQRPIAEHTISDFLATVGEHRDRGAYITQLADGTFSYFSLTTSPEAASTLASQLSPLQLFLDTNFIFGILRLGEHIWTELSEELVDIASNGALPFTLTYHPRTYREVNSAIQGYESYLASHAWGDGLARAAVRVRNVSGVVKQYLDAYVRNGIDVETFFRPFRHVDELLRARGIATFQADSNRQEERASLYQEYKEYLDSRGRPKTYNVVEHDATLLETVRHMRTSARSTIQAGALLLTYDYNLFRFDWESSRKAGRPPCVLLPNIFWQIIRPFVPPTEDFDRSFAETFALPEFRTLGSDAAAAYSRMLGLLAAYEGIEEETAIRLLSNDLLLERLSTMDDEAALRETVREALVEENRLLLEERNRLQHIAQRVADERDAAHSHLEQEKERRVTAEVAITSLESELRSRPTSDELSVAREEIRREAERASTERKRADAQDTERRKVEAQLNKMSRRLRLLLDVAAGAVTAGVLWAVWWSTAQWPWLMRNERSLGIRLLGTAAIIFFVVGLRRPKLRKRVWWSSGGAVVMAIIIASLL